MKLQDKQRHDGGWKRKTSRYLYQSQWYAVRQDGVGLPNGDDITYTMIEHPGYAMIVPLLDERRVILEQVYRYTVQQTLLECPSGGLDGQEPEIAARRELEEETGFLAGKMERLSAYYGSSGISDEVCHVFLATDLRRGGRIQRENTEQMEIVSLPFEHVYQAAMRGELLDGPTAFAILLAGAKIGYQSSPA